MILTVFAWDMESRGDPLIVFTWSRVSPPNWPLDQISFPVSGSIPERAVLVSTIRFPSEFTSCQIISSFVLYFHDSGTCDEAGLIEAQEKHRKNDNDNTVLISR
jgi:hypothetical protein